MHQSPDDIFAAHFWSWPDPALKRDAHGRVLFVNAAFLQLFGGRVEDWRGQIVQGWHAPQPGPTPARFEIRTPATPTQAEQVYDWMELTGADGSAFALARNVTPFAVQSPPPDAPAEIEPPAERQPVDAAPVFEADPVMPDLPPVAEAPEPAEAPIDTTPAVEAAPPVAPQAEPTTDLVTPSIDVPELGVPEIDVPEIAPAPADPVVAREDAPAPDAPLPEIAEPVTAVDTGTIGTTSESDAERAYERRALPIENDEAVLGNNWRDAVIAKAVGAVEPDDATAPEPPVKTGATGPIRILLAEDNAINALLTRTLLEAEGHTVETVEDGQLAVEAMKTSNFDMIFMDMRMPNMDGLEATRKIRALPSVSNDLPIVALTANAFDDDRNACFDSGMNDFMTKPVSAEELSEMVGRWTGVTEQALAS